MPNRAAVELVMDMRVKGVNDLAGATKSVKGLDKAVDDVSRKNKSGGPFSFLGAGASALMGPLGLVTAGVGALTGGLVVAAKAAIEEQVGMDRLNQTLQNSIPGWDGNTAAIDGYIDKTVALGFADDQLRDSLNFLVGQTKDLAEAQELQATAMDLARAKGISLEQATKAVAKVDQDSIAILKKLGIQVDENMTKEQALTAIREVSAGQAEKYANSAAGSMERVQNAFGDAIEDIGSVVLPKITEALGTVADIISSPEFKAGFETFVTLLSEGIGKALELVGGIIGRVAPMIGGLIDLFKDPGSETFKKALEGLPGPIAFVAEKLGDLVGKAGDFFRAVTSGDPQAVKDFFKDLPGPLGLIGEGLVSITEKAGQFLQLFDSPEKGGAYWNHYTDAMDTAELETNDFWANFKDKAKDAFTDLKEGFTLTQTEGMKFWQTLLHPATGQTPAEKVIANIRAGIVNGQREGGAFWQAVLHPATGQTPAEKFWANISWAINNAHTDGNKFWTAALNPATGQTPAEKFWQNLIVSIGNANRDGGNFWNTAMNPAVGQTPAEKFWQNLIVSIGNANRDGGNFWNTAMNPAVGQTPAEKFWENLVTSIGNANRDGGAFWHAVLNPAVENTTGQTFWGNLTEGIKKSQVEGDLFWKSVKDSLKESADKAYQVGKDIVAAIARGIADAAGEIARAAGKAVTDAIDAAKRAVGGGGTEPPPNRGGGGGGGGGGDNPPAGPPPPPPNPRTYPDRGRQHGGPVWPGRQYVVHPPEVFVPNQAGYIVPLGAGSGGLTIQNLTIHAGFGADGARIADELVDALQDRLGISTRIAHARLGGRR